MDDITGTTPTPQPTRSAFFGLGRRGAAVATAVGLMTGGVLGGYIVSHAATASTSAAATPAPGGSTAPAPGTAPDGTFHSNENAAHEAGESAAREAQENAGQMPTVP